MFFNVHSHEFCAVISGSHFNFLSLSFLPFKTGTAIFSGKMPGAWWALSRRQGL